MTEKEQIDAAEHDIEKLRKRRIWSLIAMIGLPVLLAVAMTLLASWAVASSQRADQAAAQAAAAAEANAKQAQQISDQQKASADVILQACASGAVLKDTKGKQLCQAAQEVKNQPAPDVQTPSSSGAVIGAQGAQGPRGFEGPAGKDGAPGADGKPGTAGQQGSPGVQGTQGLAGQAGLNGKDGTPGVNGLDGQPGKDGAPGKDGTPGLNGKDGRGIKTITCGADTNWVVTYTDDTTTTVAGPCRIDPTPTPTGGP